MRMIETDDILTALAPFALNAHEFAGIDVVTVLRRIGAGVAAAGRRGHRASAVVVRTAKQHAATLMRISLFTVAAKSFVVFWADFQHRWMMDVV